MKGVADLGGSRVCGAWQVHTPVTIGSVSTYNWRCAHTYCICIIGLEHH